MKNSLIISRILAIGYFISTLVLAQNVLAQPQATVTPQRITVSDPSMARKIAISYHHAILEVNYDKGYIIADLSDEELTLLKSEGFDISIDTNWKKRFEEFNQQLQSQIQLSQQKNRMQGIPGYPCYATVEETLQQGAELANNHPTLTEWIDIGDSWKKANGQNGYDLMVLKITNEAVSGDKPKLFIQSAMHAREYTTAALTLDFAKYLLNEYATNADIKWIVDYHEVHILFQTNPDGRKIAEGGSFQRKNTNQNHCPGSNVGVDLNRNFAYFWNTTSNGSSGSQCSDVFRGLTAESEPETKAVSNYIRSLFPDARGNGEQDAAPETTSGMHLDIHSFSELVLWPYGHVSRTTPNNAAFVELGNKLAWFNNYAPQQSIGLYPTDGTSDDVSYGELGIAAFTFELGTDFFQQCSVYENTIKPKNLPALVYAAKTVAAPYLLAFGPEITQITLNGSASSVTVAKGVPVNLAVTADATRSKKSTTGKKISKVEYSIDTPIWLNSSNKITLSENDGSLDSGVEVLKGQLSTQDLTAGRHIVYTQAYDQNGKVGVTSAAFLTIADGSSPVPSMTYSCNALVCNFDASSSSDDGQIVSYQWNFHDGNNATGKMASHTFTSAGDKKVSLTVRDNTGIEATKSMEFSVSSGNTLPTAEFSHQCNQLQCSFNAQASNDPDGSITAYRWNFSDGNEATGLAVSHTFASTGEKQIKLTVVDNAGGEASKTINITLAAENAAPVASFTYLCTHLKCSFDASGSSDSDGTISRYQWKFQNSSESSGKNATHTFSSAGSKQVTLTVTDNLGKEGTKNQTLTVTAAPVITPPPSKSSGGGVMLWLNGLFAVWLLRRSMLKQG